MAKDTNLFDDLGPTAVLENKTEHYLIKLGIYTYLAINTIVMTKLYIFCFSLITARGGKRLRATKRDSKPSDRAKETETRNARGSGKAT